MIAAVIAWCAKNRLLTLLGVGAAAAWGVLALRSAPLDAVPDLSDVQVIVYTEWPGRGPMLVEEQITYPVVTALLSAPGVRVVRGQSLFGASFVYVIFEDGTDLYWARSRVLEYLSSLVGRIPEGVTPRLGPDASGVGWVFEYALVDTSHTHGFEELRALQDFNLRYAVGAVEGVAEVASVGGFSKEYDVDLDPDLLAAFGIRVSDAVEAIRLSNGDVGGGVLELSGHEYAVRGRGYLRSTEDLDEVALYAKDGTAVLLRDVAVVHVGPAERRGVTDLDGEGNAAAAIVVMRYGENAADVIARVKERLAELEPGLPAGVKIVTTYDRSDLIERAVLTLRRTLVEEGIIVSLVIFVFLLHVRSALIPILTLPLAVLLAFVPMLYQHLTANIMSLGGIAIAVGAMVDASIIMIENVHKGLEHWEGAGRPGGDEALPGVVVKALQEVGPSIFFSLLVITVSFLPVFTLQATEGRLFKPLAFTKTYSMGFAAVLAVTATPALAALLVRGKIRREDESPLNRLIVALYSRTTRFVVRWRWWVLAGAAAAVAFTVPAALRLRSEFMPPLNEGTILYMPTALPGMSATEAQAIVSEVGRELHAFPEVARVFGKMGRADTATDPAPMSMAEIVVLLRPEEDWRPGVTFESLVAEMNDKVRFPGMANVWWMPIQTRTEMLSTGVRAPLGVKVFGDDLATVERVGLDVEAALAKVKGTSSAYAERLTGGLFLDVDVDRAEVARYGLRMGDVQAVIETAVGGMHATTTVEGRARYPVMVRYARDFRDDPEALGRVLVPTPTGAMVPLGLLADIHFEGGPPMLNEEDGQLTGLVLVDVAKDEALGEYVARAKAAIAAEVKLPPGYRIAWAGQYEYYERAAGRLKLVVPLTLLLVVFLLYFNTRSWTETGIVILAVPFSLVGAVWLLYALGYHVSVAVWVGMIALAGLDAETGVVMLLYLRLAHRAAAAAGRLRNHEELTEAIVHGAARRIRPKHMTVLAAFAGLLPIFWSHGAGADVMRRIAAPMAGGLVTSFVLELLVYPAIFAIWKGRTLPTPADAGAPSAAPAPAPDAR
ncbi:MAG TPA: CusA/CzcA family heavy metal efflux RND transporter [Myxococcota bacterium]|jgi:Cu(I)/Ag(I) efflux system membrane protein CusA/SilA|nr:CusA/CzcA family heavy metal efflux RND transporter [Myxococcota bacterium]